MMIFKNKKFVTGYWLAFILCNVLVTTYSYLDPEILNKFALKGSWPQAIAYMYASVNIQHCIINTAMLLGLLDYYKNAEHIPLMVVPLSGFLTGLIHLYLFPSMPILGYSGAIMGLYGSLVCFELFVDFRKNIGVHAIIMGLFIYSSYLVDKYTDINISHEAHIIGFVVGVLLCAFICVIEYFVNRVRR